MLDRILSESETIAEEKRPRRKWKRWVFPLALAGGLVWLNGPGLRWLVPLAAEHFLPKAGFRGSFELEGSLTGGLVVRNLALESDKALAKLSAERIAPVYRIGRLLQGQADGLVVDSLHADLRLGLEDETPEEEKEPLDLEKLVQTIRKARETFIPLSVQLTGLSLNASRDGKPVISLASTNLRHQPGAADITLELGAITDASGRVWPAQSSKINWSDEELAIDRLDPLPGLGVRELSVRLPETGGPAAETELLVDDAVFLLTASPGLSSVQLSLREGRLVSAKLAEHFNLELPASGELTSLTLNVDRLLPDPLAATASAQLLLEKLAYDDWAVPELSLDAALTEDRATAALRGVALGTEFAADAEAGIVRENGGFRPVEAAGHFKVAEVSRLVGSLAPRIEAIDPEVPAPVSSLDGSFNVAFSNSKPASADIEAILKPADPEAVTAIALKGRWQPEQPVSASLALDGLEATGEYDLEKSVYQARLELADFKSARIDPWLEVVRAGTKGAVSLTGKWSGGGELKEARHRGSLVLDDAQLTREGVPPVQALGEFAYDWPAGFSTKGLRVEAEKQSIALDLVMADGFLSMKNLLWRDGDKEMASGSASLPVPEDFAKWREMLSNDKRPLEVSIRSQKLTLESLKNWLPAAAKIDPRSTGLLDVKVSGNYGAPAVDVLLEARDLRAPEQPKLPPADLRIAVTARDDRLSVDGGVTAPDFPPAVLSASMPFHPAGWAEKPDLLLEENVTARVDLPRIDLARFSSLVPDIRKLAGILTGNFEVAGKLGKPDVKGRIDLTGGAVEMAGQDIPPVSGLAVSVDLALDRIALKQLKATVAGGTLDASGSLALDGGKPGALDFRVKGGHLPLKRDDSLIVRANADLRLAGPWEQAALTGTVGVVDSIFYRDIELLPIGSPFTAPSAAALPKIDASAKPADSVPEPFRNWTINVLARTENPFLIRGNLATGRVDVNLRVGGSVGNPLPDGEVRISDFKAALPFSTLKVRSGTVRFTPANGLDPVLEIRGTAEPRPYQVAAFIHGKASDPQLVLTSSPPLPENEIMTLLATGTTTSGLEDPQQASSRAMQLFAEELRRGRFKVGKRLRPLLGLLDRVDFSVAEADPYSSASYSTATLQLTDRWYLSAGMGDEGDSRVLGIWRLRFY